MYKFRSGELLWWEEHKQHSDPVPEVLSELLLVVLCDGCIKQST
jgi:hypothetical protein